MSKTLENGSFQDAVGTVVNAGTIEFVLSHDAMIIAGGQVAPTRVTATLDSTGDMPANFTILANDELTPTGTFYLTTVFDSNGARVFGPERWVFSGSSPIDLDTMTPTIVDPAFANPVLQNPSADQSVTGAFDLALSTPTQVVFNDASLTNASGAGFGYWDLRGTYSAAQTVDRPFINIVLTQSGADSSGQAFKALSVTQSLESTATGVAGWAIAGITTQKADQEATAFFGSTSWQGASALTDPKRLFSGDFAVLVDVDTYSVANAAAVEGVANVIGTNTSRTVYAFYAATSQTGNPTSAYYVAAEASTGNFQYGLDLKDNAFDQAAIRVRDGSLLVKRNAADSADLTVINFATDNITTIQGATDVRLNSGATLMAGVNANGLFVNSAQRMKFGDVQALDDTGTPSVSAGNIFNTGGTTAITAFDDGLNGQVITIVSLHSVTITDGSALNLAGAGNYSMTADDTLTLVFTGTNWYETARSVN